MLDLESKMYVACGMSLKSEKQAFDRAMEMLKGIDINIDSVRLDRYYSYLSYVDKFEGAESLCNPREKCHTERLIEMERHDGRVCA